MSTLTTCDRIAIGLAVVSTVALLAELLWQHDLEQPAAPVVNSDLAVESATAGELVVGPISDYWMVAERPLFTIDRRPFVLHAEPPPPAPAGPRPEFELTAVIITSTAQIALLRSNMSPTVRRVSVNEEIDGWILAMVSSDSVVLRRDAETLSVPLRPDPAGIGQAMRIDSLGRVN